MKKSLIFAMIAILLLTPVCALSESAQLGSLEVSFDLPEGAEATPSENAYSFTTSLTPGIVYGMRVIEHGGIGDIDDDNLAEITEAFGLNDIALEYDIAIDDEDGYASLNLYDANDCSWYIVERVDESFVMFSVVSDDPIPDEAFDIYLEWIDTVVYGNTGVE